MNSDQIHALVDASQSRPGRRSYPDEVKRAVVDLVSKRMSVTDAAEAFGISRQTISRWVEADRTDHEFWTASQASHHLQISLNTFYVLYRADEIPGAVKIAGLIRVHRETFLKESGVC